MNRVYIYSYIPLETPVVIVMALGSSVVISSHFPLYNILVVEWPT